MAEVENEEIDLTKVAIWGGAFLVVAGGLTWLMIAKPWEDKTKKEQAKKEAGSKTKT